MSTTQPIVRRPSYLRIMLGVVVIAAGAAVALYGWKIGNEASGRAAGRSLKVAAFGGLLVLIGVGIAFSNLHQKYCGRCRVLLEKTGRQFALPIERSTELISAYDRGDDRELMQVAASYDAPVVAGQPLVTVFASHCPKCRAVGEVALHSHDGKGGASTPLRSLRTLAPAGAQFVATLPPKS